MTEVLTQPLNEKIKNLLRYTLLDYVSIFFDDEAFDTSKRLLCEMPACGSLINVSLPGYKVRREVVRSTMKRCGSYHFYFQNLENEYILCPTVGQFCTGILPSKLFRGARIDGMRKRAPELFFPLDDENYYLYGNREEIADRVKLVYP